MPKLTYTARFSRSYRDLTDGRQSQIDAAIRAVVAAYPHIHRAPKRFGPPHVLEAAKGTPKNDRDRPPKVWDAHAPGPEGLLVMTFQLWPDEIVFRNCGEHDAVIKNY